MSVHRLVLLTSLLVAGTGLWLIGASPAAAVKLAGATAGALETPRMLGGLLLGGGLLGMVRLAHPTA